MLKICLTGGPCSGKTTVLKHLVRLVEEKGYVCLVCEESATSLIDGGIKPNKDGLSMKDFQRFVLSKQISNENLINELPQYINNDKIVVFYDRGLNDQQAYVTPEIFSELLKEQGLDDSVLENRYDYVLHLVSTAKDSIENYQWNDPSKKETGNNAARYEPPEIAAEIDDKIYDAWKNYYDVKIFDNSTNFKKKIQRVVNEIEEILSIEFQ
jgi:predicted ATPase